MVRTFSQGYIGFSGALGPKLHIPEIPECKYWLRFHNPLPPHEHGDGLMQDCTNSIAIVENQGICWNKIIMLLISYILCLVVHVCFWIFSLTYSLSLISVELTDCMYVSFGFKFSPLAIPNKISWNQTFMLCSSLVGSYLGYLAHWANVDSLVTFTCQKLTHLSYCNLALSHWCGRYWQVNARKM